MRNYQLKLLGLVCGALVCTSARAGSGNAGSEAPATQTAEPSKAETLLNAMPKISGYIQTGYNWGDENGDNRSSFQMKRMRLFIDKKLSDIFDVRAQFEVFSGSTDGAPYNKKVMTIMDMFVGAHVSKGLNFRLGQYYLPLGFENYDISPSTLETVDFSNICYRMVCRNAISTPNLIDYGRDVGLMAYGDLLGDVVSYNLSVSNGHLPTLNDNNRSKDLVGRLTIRPVKNLRIMGSYNWGEYKGLNRDGEARDYLPMNRIVAGVWYNDPSGLVLRSEYGNIRSERANVNEDGLYVLAGYRAGKWLPVVRWDMYRDKASTSSAVNRDNFLAGCTYEVHKDIKLQLNYIYSVYPDAVKKADVRTGAGNSIQVMCLLKF